MPRPPQLRLKRNRIPRDIKRRNDQYRDELSGFPVPNKFLHRDFMGRLVDIRDSGTNDYPGWNQRVEG